MTLKAIEELCKGLLFLHGHLCDPSAVDDAGVRAAPATDGGGDADGSAAARRRGPGRASPAPAGVPGRGRWA